MRAVKNNLPTPSGEVEESEGPRRYRASLGEPGVGREEWSPQSKATRHHPRWVAWIGEVDHNREWKILSAIREIKGAADVGFAGKSDC